MTRSVRFTTEDTAALRKLDADAAIDDSNEVAVISGDMKLKVVRLAHDSGDQFRLTLTFPGAEELEIRIARVQLLRELGVEVNKS